LNQSQGPKKIRKNILKTCTSVFYHWPIDTFVEIVVTYPEDWVDRGKGIRKRDGNSCSICGRSNIELHVHHVTPLSKGGNNDVSNLMTVCIDCHNKMHEKHQGEKEVEISSGFYCLNCDRFYTIEFGRQFGSCEVCGNKLRPWVSNRRD